MTSRTTEKWRTVNPQIDVVFPLLTFAFYSFSASSLAIMVISYPSHCCKWACLSKHPSFFLIFYLCCAETLGILSNKPQRQTLKQRSVWKWLGVFPRENHRAMGKWQEGKEARQRGDIKHSPVGPQARGTLAQSCGEFGRQCRSSLKAVPIRAKRNEIFIPHLTSLWLRVAAGAMSISKHVWFSLQAGKVGSSSPRAAPQQRHICGGWEYQCARK